jgi:ribosomal protein S18 acetylase RimI-like enzyme
MIEQLHSEKTSVRAARPEDIPRIVGFEIEIARISFPEDPMDDPEAHRKKLLKAMEKDPRGMFVLEEEQGEVIGWMWITLNTNFLTGERYATFRSFAVDEVWRGTPIIEAFFRNGLDYCRQEGVARATGKVHVSNIAMRSLYKNLGFRPTHLTMEINLGPIVGEPGRSDS